MVYLLYDIVVWLIALFLVPCYLVRGLIQGKVRHGLRERLGFFAPERFHYDGSRQVFWIHAVSVGETRAAIPLIKALRKNYPDAVLVLSNVTETGHEIARGIQVVDECFYFPLDASWVVQRVVQRVRPNQVIIVETELWPNFIRTCSRFGIPVHLVNGRFSDRSFPRYLRFKKLLQPLLELLSSFCMQSRVDADRVEQLGAPVDRIVVTGNIKFDMESSLPTDVTNEQLRREFHVPETCRVLVAGSTHSGEEELVITVYQQLRKRFDDLLLILVPRHPERCDQVAEWLTDARLQWQRRSQLSDQTLSCGQVLLVDTIGEMLKFYQLAQVVFVGGSLVPIGGHNVLEASLLKKPVLFGPYMHNFREIAAMINQAQGGGRIEDSDALRREFERLLDDPQACQAMGEKGWVLLQKNSGATLHTLQHVLREKT
nr:3-deoxy-D-manno-octulosonic acid transferase [uncultured Desulfuromonas sp.]